MKRALLFGGVPVIAGIALIIMWAMANKTTTRGTGWTQVVATIESTKVQPGGVDIAYRYEYGGRPYRNPAGHLTLRAVSNPAARYAAGRQIVAYVNPATPSESILESAPRPSSVNLIAGVVLLLIGFPLGAYLLREKQQQFRPRGKPVRKPTQPGTGTPSKPGNPGSGRPSARLKPPPSSRN